MNLIYGRPFRSLNLKRGGPDPKVRWRWIDSWEKLLPRMPAVDVSENDDTVTVKAEVPGLKKKNLKLSLDDGYLVIRGETSEEHKQNGRNFRWREIRHGSIFRRIPLPAEVDPRKAKARLRDGVLEVSLPKTEKAKTRRIKVEYD